MTRAVAVVLLFGLACAKEEPYTRSSEVATAPEGSRWRSASASILYQPARFGVHASSSASVTLSLHLEGAEGAKDVVLDEYLEGGDGPGDTPKSVYERAKQPALALRFAPDGSALGVSFDGGTAYRIVALDGEEPLYCAHATFDGDWANAPSGRALMFEILASAEPPLGSGRLHLEPGEHPRGRSRFQTELARARDFACAHLDDAELRHALVQAAVLPGRQLEGSSEQEDLLVACVTKAVVEHGGEQEVLIAALRDGAPEQQARAARALADGGDAAAQAAVADTLSKLPSGCKVDDPSCIDSHLQQASFAWAIANISTRLGTLPVSSRDALIIASKSDHPVVRVHATRGLALSRDDVAIARLRELAAEPCDAPLATWDDRLPAFNRLYPEPHAASCWALAALAR